MKLVAIRFVVLIFVLFICVDAIKACSPCDSVPVDIAFSAWIEAQQEYFGQEDLVKALNNEISLMEIDLSTKLELAKMYEELGLEEKARAFEYLDDLVATGVINAADYATFRAVLAYRGVHAAAKFANTLGPVAQLYLAYGLVSYTAHISLANYYFYISTQYYKAASDLGGQLIEKRLLLKEAEDLLDELEDIMDNAEEEFLVAKAIYENCLDANTPQ